MTMRCHAYDPTVVAQVRSGGPDAHGPPAEHSISDGQGKPCRSCLQQIPAGQGMLILAARPFPVAQPHAETGPIFLCAGHCAPWDRASIPPVLTTSPDYLLKGYGANHRIIHGTGRVVAADQMAAYAEQVFADALVAYVDVRSARNNCFQTRITHDDS